jgi:L-lactate dehydrogenase complex protein LldG
VGEAVAMTGRDQILRAVRAALHDVPADEPAAWDPAADPDPAAAYLRTTSLDGSERADLFAERCGEYRATVTRCAADEGAIRDAVTAACTRHGARVLAVPADLDPAWVPEGVASRVDNPTLAWADLDGCDGALTGSALAIAPTGTIVLDGGAQQGRRALTLIPDLHICVVLADAIAGSVPEAVARIGAGVADRGTPATFVSGPSATSDIELQRVEGVHGPRRLEVIVAG